MEEIKPLVMEKTEFEYEDKRIILAIVGILGIKVV